MQVAIPDRLLIFTIRTKSDINFCQNIILQVLLSQTVLEPLGIKTVFRNLESKSHFLMIYNSIIDTIGNTPMVKLNNVVKGIQGTVLAKVEYFNPGNSTKDRMALKMVEDAEKGGLAKTRWYNYRRHIGKHRYGPGACRNS